ncbi:hypothetical protein ABPG74_004892 [Tetrahymena malaccensis]
MKFFFVVLFLLAALTLSIDAKMLKSGYPKCHTTKQVCAQNSDCCDLGVITINFYAILQIQFLETRTSVEQIYTVSSIFKFSQYIKKRKKQKQDQQELIQKKEDSKMKECNFNNIFSIQYDNQFIQRLHYYLYTIFM